MAIVAAFAVGLSGFLELLTKPAGHALTLTLWPWIHAGAFGADVALVKVVAVYLGAAAVASLSPTPGGLGAVQIVLPSTQ